LGVEVSVLEAAVGEVPERAGALGPGPGRPRLVVGIDSTLVPSRWAAAVDVAL
jgi:hypothetical protein